ncbi:MAG: phospholipase D-like domain-containing protein, partial [Methanotrichaceae archaeon]
MKNLGCSCIVVLTLIICTICSASGVQANSIDILASGIQPSALQPQVFVEPTDGYKPVLDALNSAQSSIFVEMYLMTDKNIIDALRNAASRGVKVRVMLEKNAYDNPADLQAIMDSLNSSGISVETSSPAFYLTHEKAIVIDRRIAIIMTLNQDHTAYTKNREFGLIDCNTTDAAEIAATFEADWNRTVPELSDPNLVWSPANSRSRILSLINGAEQSL